MEVFDSPFAMHASVAMTRPLLNRHSGSYFSLICSSFLKFSAPQSSSVLLYGALHKQSHQHRVTTDRNERQHLHVVGVIVDGRLVEAVLEVAQVGHHLVLVLRVQPLGGAVVAPLARRQGDVGARRVRPRGGGVGVGSGAVPGGEDVCSET